MATASPYALDQDLRLAEKVYLSLLPQRVTRDGIDVLTRVWPANHVGGDYATVFPSREGQLYCCVSDVTSHGIASSLLVSRVDSFVREHVPLAHHPCEIIEKLNKFCCEHFDGLGMYLSFFCADIDLQKMQLSYAGCGHPPALLLKAGGETKWLESQHTLIGMFPELSEVCFIDREPLERGDRVIIYTDGITEGRNPAGEFFGEERLAAAAVAAAAGNPRGCLLADRIYKTLMDFQGEAESQDDVLLMVVSVT